MRGRRAAGASRRAPGSEPRRLRDRALERLIEVRHHRAARSLVARGEVLRLVLVEPVDRSTLRLRPKVNARWHLYCLVHNIEELAHHGYTR
jgi:hypothetical protein